MALLLTDNNTDLVRDKDIRNQETGAAKYKKQAQKLVQVDALETLCNTL